MKEIRCGRCHALLAKADKVGKLEIKCRRCRSFNIVEAIENEPLNGLPQEEQEGKDKDNGYTATRCFCS
ncbi:MULTISPECIES: Com family DNA-binding transcriptional regulator [Bartonella]|uniref:Com family DNA-binding transcriptional regulator n=1 Tax=Bartonella TaxID=773 RepID=UPI0018DE82D9|nr:Com family DNA-binding transcriptional regulator [Bartonella choladocola]MBI0177594.1 Com family DNA-binding transcriptional regulator [Bartonella apis]